MTIAPRQLALALTATLIAVSIGHAKPADRQSKHSALQTQRFCEEERKLAEPWIQWASDNRLACVQQTPPGPERQDCFNAIIAQLDSLQKEHAEVYLSQITTVSPDHPVMSNLLARLWAHRESAITVLQTGVDPIQLAAHRQQRCLAQQ